MNGKRFLGAVALALLLALALSCQSVRPPEECAVKGGVADQAAFARHFTEMSLASDKQIAPFGDHAMALTSDGVLEVVATGLANTATNLCTQERKGGGKVVYNQTLTLPQGESRTRLGSFAPGEYVIRVIVDGVLVRNLTFGVR